MRSEKKGALLIEWGAGSQAEHLPHVQRSWGRKELAIRSDEKKLRKYGKRDPTVLREQGDQIGPELTMMRS